MCIVRHQIWTVTNLDIVQRLVEFMIHGWEFIDTTIGNRATVLQHLAQKEGSKGHIHNYALQATIWYTLFSIYVYLYVFCIHIYCVLHTWDFQWSHVLCTAVVCWNHHGRLKGNGRRILSQCYHLKFLLEKFVMFYFAIPWVLLVMKHFKMNGMLLERLSWSLHWDFE